MVDLVWPHIKFINIRPLEGGIRVFICILWRISRFLTTRSAERATYGNFLLTRTKIIFVSCSTGFKLSSEPGAWIFPHFFKKSSSGATIPLWTDSVVRGSLLPLLKFWPNRRSVDLLIPLFEIRTDSAVRRSLDPIDPLLKFRPNRRSVGPCFLLSKFWPIRRSVDPLKNSDQIGGLWVPAFSFKNLDQFGRPCFPFLKFRPNRQSVDPPLKITTKSAVRGSLHPPLKITTRSAIRGSLPSFSRFHLERENDS